MGNPDNSTPKHIVEKLIETLKMVKTHRYSVSKGILDLEKLIVIIIKKDLELN